jgi:hypothetical protein
MPRVGFESMIPVFERAKIVHTLDRVVTVTGMQLYLHSFTSVVLRNSDNFVSINWIVTSAPLCDQ